MRCISPLLIKKSGRRDFVPCGKCNFCLARRRADWTFRLVQELKVSVASTFLTLTYDELSLYGPHLLDQERISRVGIPQLCKRDMQLFTKRVRKENETLCDYPIRYYSVGEYGSNTLRPHYHSIMFNLHPRLLMRISDIWKLGHVYVGDVTTASIHYVTKYVINAPGEYPGREPPFSLISNRPGIGVNYLATHTQWHREDLKNYTKINGQISSIPRYYKNRLFTDSERKILAAEAVALADVAYLDEILFKAEFNSNPALCYDESVSSAHDSIHSKINQLNKI